MADTDLLVDAALSPAFRAAVTPEEMREMVTLTRDPDGWPIAANETAGTRPSTWIFGDLPVEVEAADGSVALNLTLGGLRLGQLRDGAPLGIFEDTRDPASDIDTRHPAETTPHRSHHHGARLCSPVAPTSPATAASHWLQEKLSFHLIF